ncbi:MAG: GntR family transcriptional regulator [Burkholderiaceae bacterium]|nr:GntR family transcriptional regulator [Burkholderiaceae bacterium]
MREALHQLAAIGLIEMRRARSPIVAAFTVQDLLDAFEVMAQLEALCGRLAARRATEADRAALEHSFEDAAEAARVGDIDEYYRCDVAFHDVLYRAAHNGLLEEQLRALRNRFGPYRRRHFAWRGRIEQSHEEHARMIAAIKNGDPDETEVATRAHVSMNGEVLADFLRSLGELHRVAS